jgi:DNA repair protein RecO (recombination protein O)
VVLPGIVRTVGIVVGRLDYGNTSRILTFVTPDCGRVGALLKGARRPAGRPGLGGGLDLLSENEILFYERRAGLAILAEWSEVRCSGEIGRDAVRFAAAECCAEYVRECSIEGQAEPGLYRLLSEGLECVARAERLVPPALSVALGALECVGLAPRAGACVECGSAAEVWRRGRSGLLSGRAGGLLCPDCAGAAEPDVPALCPEAVALFGVLARMVPAAAARLRPSRRAELDLLRAVEHYARWRLERRMWGLTGLAALIARLEAAGCV